MNINEVSVSVNEVSVNEGVSLIENDIIKKKRGRKAKIICEPITQPIIDSESPTDESHTDDDVIEMLAPDIASNIAPDIASNIAPDTLTDQSSKSPKKRGRKPKGGKIITNSIFEEIIVVHEPNIILHLKCKFSDLDGSSLTSDCKGIDAFQFEKTKGTELGYHIIDNNMNNAMHASNKSSTSASTSYSYSTSSSTNENDIKNLYAKIKEISYNLQNNNISDKKSDCFWCTCSFDNPPIYIPKHKLNDTYQCYGCFCSPECATSFLFKESIDASTRFERYYLLNHIYNKVYNYTKNIKPAPDPYYTLNKYYGTLSIQEYRRLFKSERLLMVVDKPLSRILPELHEYNDDILMNENTQNTGKYTIKRKTKQKKTDILNEAFNIQ